MPKTAVLRVLLPLAVGLAAPLLPVAPASAAPLAAAPVVLQAEGMSLPAASGQAFTDPTAAGRAGLIVWSNGTASGSLSPAGPTARLVVRARGDQCEGAPVMRVSVDGVVAGSRPVSTTSWGDYEFSGRWAAGPREVTVAFTNDHSSTCDRNLRLDRIILRSTPTPTLVPMPAPGSAGNAFAGASPYRDPTSRAGTEAAARRATDPAGAAALDRIAATSAASWYGDWNRTDTLTATVQARVTAVRAAGALPVLVAYDIPHRDCGSYSAGGAPDADAYRQWIAALAAGIGNGRAAVVLEPDALPQMDCLSAPDQAERTALLAAAVTTLEALPGTDVYLDAGGATWHSAAVMAPRLAAAGVARARGFSLNVSGYTATSVNLPYGRDLSSRLGGTARFLIDTSRNGLGQGDTWCNPAGRALGSTMTSVTGEPLADAFTWIKQPGESDGTCNGGPPAGQFWTEQAVGLAQRAA